MFQKNKNNLIPKVGFRSTSGVVYFDHTRGQNTQQSGAPQTLKGWGWGFSLQKYTSARKVVPKYFTKLNKKWKICEKGPRKISSGFQIFKGKWKIP